MIKFCTCYDKIALMEGGEMPLRTFRMEDLRMKIWKLMLSVAMVAVVLLALASCGCEHVYDEAISNAPTCTEKGEKTFSCSLCGDVYTEDVEATGHTYTEKVTAPTCTAEGYTTYTCACGETYTDNTVAATGHTYTDTVVAPTCTADGYTSHTCACGETYTDNTVAATGVHTYVEGVAPITEELKAKYPAAVGVKGEVCSLCGAAGNVAGGDIVLLNMDFETKATSLLDYVKTLDGVAPYGRSESMTSGMIQNGKWYNTSFDQVFIDEDLGLRSMGVFTVSFDCQLGLEFTQGVRDQIFGWCSYATDVALSDRFTIQLGQDNKLHYLINYKDSAKNTEKLAGYTFEDRTAWYHFDFTVNTVDQTVTVAFGIWTDESFTTLTGYQVLGVATGFQNQGATRVEDAFRFSRNQGVLVMDNFVVCVPTSK